MNDLGISSAPVWRDKKSSGSYSPAGTPRTQPFGGNSCYPGLNDSCDDDSAFLPGFSTTIDGDGESRKLANMDYVRGTFSAVTSKTAQRTLVNTILLVVASTILYGSAAFGYLLFYHNYLPDQVTSVPVHLQYGYGLNPYGVAFVGNKNLKDLQAYDITVSLTLPRSPANLDRGNFMVALHLLSQGSSSVNPSLKSKVKLASGPTPSANPSYPHYPDHPGIAGWLLQPNPYEARFGNDVVLFTATRPALIPYTDPLVSLASRVFFLAYHILFPHSETSQLKIDMAEKVTFERGGPLPERLFIELQAGQGLQVYSATVTLTAQLSGLRYIMYHYWLASFIVFSAAFWLCEVCFMGLAWAALSIFLQVPAAGVKTEEPETESEGKRAVVSKPSRRFGEDMSDTERTFPSTSRQMPLKFEGKVKSEELERLRLGDILPVATGLGAEADDEDDDDGAGFRDSGIGTSYSEGNRDGVRRRTSGSRGRR